jgi:hypothetical protein
MEQVIETIAAMLHQEQTGYGKQDWTQLAQLESAAAPTCTAQGPLHHHSPDLVDVDCRSKMATWCIQVVDFCKFSRETVEIAMSNLDRYMVTPAGRAARNDRSIYQLACMAALYTAVKIHEPESMDPKLVSRLSQGVFSSKDVEAMEANLLMALNWRVNPPTALSFVRKLMELIPEDALNGEMRHTVIDVAKFQTELAIHEYQFVTVEPSTIAYCTLINSMESLGLDEKVVGYLGHILSQALKLDCKSDRVAGVQNTLYRSVFHNPVAPSFARRKDRSPTDKTANRSMSIEVSPRSVSRLTGR